MKITFLGVDGCIPAPGSDTASFLFERGLMIDVGWHATETLRRCGKTPADVRSVLFTHCHHDHVMALPALLYERFAQSTAGELHLYGPEPLRETLERAMRFLQTEIYWPEARQPVLHILSGGETLEICGYTVRTLQSRHAVPGICYRIEENGRAVGLTGDTAAFSGLGAFFRGCEAVISEYSWGVQKDGENRPRHLDIADAAQIAREAGAKALYPVHGPRTLQSACAERARQIFSGEIRWAKPGDTVCL